MEQRHHVPYSTILLYNTYNYSGPLGMWHCSTYWLRTAGHFARFTPDSDFFHHTFCTVHTVHTVCSLFTLVVNPLFTTIVHHIFSSVLAVPQVLANIIHGSIIISAWFHQSSCFIAKPIRPGCLGSREHSQCSIRAGRFTAHHFRSIWACCPRERHVHSRRQRYNWHSGHQHPQRSSDFQDGMT